MASSHAAIAGSTESLRKVRRALLSVSDKAGVVELARCLAQHGVELLSTGGTAAALRGAGLRVVEVSDYTLSPEMLDGRVKTLHPKVHGGILAVRGNAKHEADMAANGISPIDMVVLNLYPFEQTVRSGADFATCVENVDIGGPAMLRASAKNHAGVVIATSPSQYASIMAEMSAHGGCTTIELRRRCAAAAFALSAHYDGAIASYLAREVAQEVPTATRTYVVDVPLKYGCNPNQLPAALCRIGADGKMPFKVLNGKPGYINLLDASNAWQLVRELKAASGLAAAASFKHVSPAGAAVAVPLSAVEEEAYELKGRDIKMTPSALAYLRARQADPMCSFGDFAALSDVVDVDTANVLKVEVSDGIVAPGYEPEALEILKKKKSGAFIVLEADVAFQAPELEYREVFGQGFMQRRNDCVISKAVLKDVPTAAKTLDEAAQRDLLVATVALKYTQSNSIAYAKDGMVVGVGAGQQSRVDCAKLAGRKVKVWFLRQHPKVLALKFKAGVKRQDKINARVRYIEGDMAPTEYKTWAEQFDEVPAPLTEQEKDAFMATLTKVSLSSDAFFPFRDSIDVAAKLGVSYVAQTGGSVQDKSITEACDEYGMVMAMTGVRLFHH